MLSRSKDNYNNNGKSIKQINKILNYEKVFSLKHNNKRLEFMADHLAQILKSIESSQEKLASTAELNALKESSPYRLTTTFNFQIIGITKLSIIKIILITIILTLVITKIKTRKYT
jgi:hypothetical protein